MSCALSEELLAVEHIDEALADALIAGRPFEDMLAIDSVLAGSLSDDQRADVYRALTKTAAPGFPGAAAFREELSPEA